MVEVLGFNTQKVLSQSMVQKMGLTIKFRGGPTTSSHKPCQEGDYSNGNGIFLNKKEVPTYDVLTWR